MRALRGYFTGRNIALAVIAVPLSLVLSVGLASFAGHPGDWFWGVAIDLCAIGAALGLSSLLTATLAYPVQKRVGSPVPNAADGYGGQAFAGSMSSLFGVALISVPVILALIFTHSLADCGPHPAARGVRGRLRRRAGLGRGPAGRQRGRGQDAGTLPDWLSVASCSWMAPAAVAGNPCVAGHSGQ